MSLLSRMGTFPWLKEPVNLNGELTLTKILIKLAMAFIFNNFQDDFIFSVDIFFVRTVVISIFEVWKHLKGI